MTRCRFRYEKFVDTVVNANGPPQQRLQIHNNTLVLTCTLECLSAVNCSDRRNWPQHKRMLLTRHVGQCNAGDTGWLFRSLPVQPRNLRGCTQSTGILSGT